MYDLKKNYYIQLCNSNSSEFFSFTKEEEKEIEEEKSHYPDSRAASIQALKIIQKNHGWVSDSAIKNIGKILEISSNHVEEVATFYSQIFRKKVGRNIIRYCDSVVCYITGFKNIKKELEECLKIKPGETTLDGRFTLLPTCCLGKCDQGPTMMVNDDTYILLTKEKIMIILEKY